MSYWSQLESRTKAAVPFRPQMVVPYTQDKQPVWSDWSVEAAVKDGYQASVWVYRGISSIARACASVPWVVQQKQGDEWVTVENHPCSELIENPNANMSRAEWIERYVTHLILAGNAISAKTRGSGNQVLEVWPINPVGIKPVISATAIQQIILYRYEYDGLYWELAPEDVVHAQFPDPSNLWWGQSPLKAASRIVDSDVEAISWNKVTLQNRAVPEGLLFLKGASRDEVAEAEHRIKTTRAGSAVGRSVWVIGGPDGAVDYKQLGISAVDMDWVSGLKMTREGILACLGVPPIVAGLYEDASLNNAREAQRLFWRNTVLPLMESLRSVFARTLLVEYDRSGSLWLDYDTTNVEALRDDIQAKATTFQILVQNGVPANDAIKLLEINLAPIEGGDEPNGLKVSAPSPFASPMPEEEPEPDEPEDDEEAPEPADEEEDEGSGPDEAKAARRRDQALEEAKALNSVADVMAPLLADLFLRAVKTLSAKVDVERLMAYIEVRPVEELLRYFPLDELAKVLRASKQLLERAFREAGKVAAGFVRERSKRDDFEFRSDAQTELWTEQRADFLSRVLPESSRRGIEQTLAAWKADPVLLGAVVGGGASVGTFWRGWWGLNAQQQQAYTAYVKALMDAGYSRLEATKRARAYGDQLILERAQGIGMAEAQTAVGTGATQAAHQAVEDGVYAPQLLKTWVTYEQFMDPDDQEPCPICKPMDRKSMPVEELFYPPVLKGVGLEHPWDSHPQCRCMQVTTPENVLGELGGPDLGIRASGG